MSTVGFTRVGIIGVGVMGAGIADACARAGVHVVVIDRDVQILQAGMARISASLDRAVRAGRIGEHEAARARANIVLSTDYSALMDREMVIEAATEDEQAKISIFRQLDQMLPADVVLASNTSSIPIAKIALATRRPERVIGMHFFNPVPVQPLVEIIPSSMTSDDARGMAETLASQTLGKNVIFAPDSAGFIVNALLIPYLLSAIRMLEGGHATREDIDAGMVHGCGHPMGPLALVDLIGLDTVKSIAEILFADRGEPHLLPPPLLSSMVDAGLTGRKSGRGFYDYAP